MNMWWKVPLSNFDFDCGNGTIISLAYINPRHLFQFLMELHPEILVGGVDDPQQRALHLEAFWEAFRLQHPDHVVFQEHGNNLNKVVPLFWHGDEGRGKRRGNTVVIDCEAPIGLATSLKSKKTSRNTCGCQPPASLKRKFSNSNQELPHRLKSPLKRQQTNMRGHSFLQHFTLCVIPSVWHHSQPGLLLAILEHIATQFKILFYEGISIGPNNFCFAVCGHKGDLKWFTKVSYLDRSYEHQGRVRNIQCCHECLAGGNIPWEDLSECPAWVGTCFTQRPWSRIPPLAIVPFNSQAPEKQLRRDFFHICKLGVFRDHAAGCVVYMVREGLFGPGDFDTKLRAAHGAFKLWCSTSKVSPALRSFSRALLSYPNFSTFPWYNAKGSDVMLLLRWLLVQCTAFQNDPSNGADRSYLDLMKQTTSAGLNIFKILNSHGLFLERDCGLMLYAEITRFINGYNLLANKCLNTYNLWGLKPKIHLLKHANVELYQSMMAGHDVVLSVNSMNCEQNEDLIGRVCRLSRRMDTRQLCKRVLQACLLKSSLLYGKARHSNRIWH